MSVRQDLTIDAMNLDQEWANLPTLYQSYSEKAENLDSLSKSEKINLDLQSARKEKDIRLNPKDHGIEKISEAAVKMALAMDVDLIAIRTKILEIDREKKVVQTACRGLEFKKDAIKGLITLYGMEYYTMPSNSVDGKKFIQAQLDSAVGENKAKSKEKLNKKKNKKKE